MSSTNNHMLWRRPTSSWSLILITLAVMVGVIAAAWLWSSFLFSQQPHAADTPSTRTRSADPLLTPATDEQPTLTTPRITHWNLMRGPMQAPITIVEYSNFACDYCAKVQPELQKLFTHYPNQVRLVWKDLPDDDQPLSRFAHQAGRCAAEQKAFWPFHDRIFNLPQPLTAASISATAENLGLHMPTFNSCLANPDVDVLIDYDLTEAEDLGISGTPFFYINNLPLLGDVTFEELAETIEHLLDETTTTPAL